MCVPPCILCLGQNGEYSSVVLDPKLLETKLKNGLDPNTIPKYNEFSQECKVLTMVSFWPGGFIPYCGMNSGDPEFDFMGVPGLIERPVGYNLTLLHFAVYHGEEQSIRILLRHGATKTRTTSAGLKPYDIAVTRGLSNEILRLLNPNLDAELGAPTSQEQMIGSLLDKPYFCLLSHYKAEAGIIARLLKNEMEQELKRRHENRDVFLDVDNLGNLNALKECVKKSRVLVLLQTKEVLTRPWVITEILTAIENEVPILTVIDTTSNSYNFQEISNFLEHFETKLEEANPGASAVLLEQFPHLKLQDMAYLLSTTIPNVLSKKFDGNADAEVIGGMVKSIVNECEKAVLVKPVVDRETWDLRRGN
jgi:hypothetical protein